MSELAVTADQLPDRSDAPPSFLRLAARMASLSTSALALQMGVAALQQRMEDKAADLEKRAEQCTAAEVEDRFTVLMQDAAVAVRDVATASGEMAQAAEHMAVHATGVRDTHQEEYGGIHEAVNSSGVRQAVPGFYATR